MNNRPTAYELGQEYAKLEKAYDEALAASEKTLALATVAREAWEASGADMAYSIFMLAAADCFNARDKEMALKKELDKVKKQAWRWYGVAI
jgi:hypothetical protein